MCQRWPRLLLLPLLLMAFLLCFQDAYSHKQPVHQYIAREGYSLLIQKVGHDIPALTAGIGLADQSFSGDSAWQKGCITTGAWREDEEDLVYHYDVLPGLNYALTSITHFWDADQGDNTQNMFRLMVERSPLPPVATDIGPYHNTYEKMMQFAHGGWALSYPRTIFCQNTANNHYLVITPLVSTLGFGIPLQYDGLPDFYKSMKLKVRADQPALCEVLDVNALKTINLSDVAEVRVQEDVRNVVAWEILGRMCHLLGDMSVPAHVHRDEHGLNPDSYEDYVGGTGDPYRTWDHTNSGAPVLLNNLTDDEALHFLMYTMQEQSDHFGSNGPAQGNGNDIVGGNPSTAERDFLNAVELGSLGGPTTDAGPWTIDNLNIIRDRTMPSVIRATAGLLYWFCRGAGLVETVTGTAANKGTPAGPISFSLEQNYPNPFNPFTTIKYTVGGNGASGVGNSAEAGVGNWELGARKTRLTVYDVLGRQVATLVDEVKAPGSYEARFDGSRLVSGVYIVRLTAGSFVASKRMVLLK